MLSRRRSQLPRQRVGPLSDRSSPQAHDIIAWFGQRLHDRRELLRVVERDDMTMPSCAHAGDQGISIGTCNRLFTGWIDMRDDHAVGVVETGAERLEQ